MEAQVLIGLKPNREETPVLWGLTPGLTGDRVRDTKRQHRTRRDGHEGPWMLSGVARSAFGAAEGLDLGSKQWASLLPMRPG